jgi:PAS domain-containing protein
MRHFNPINSFVTAILEGFNAGILILSNQGEILYANSIARRICDQLNPNFLRSQKLPKEVDRAYQALVESRDFYTQQPVILESEIHRLNGSDVRLQAEWLSSEEGDRILIRLEEKQRSVMPQTTLEYRMQPLIS